MAKMNKKPERFFTLLNRISFLVGFSLIILILPFELNFGLYFCVMIN